MSRETPRMGDMPIFDGMRGYRKDWLRLDLVAGLTTAAVVVPKAMAYATVAGLPARSALGFMRIGSRRP